ncbi:MAG: branched chain amino acid aminotransferase, partial [Oscillospiraceae bacterium]
MITLKKELITHAKRKPCDDSLEFGKIFTDHMLLVSYDKGQGWHNPLIKPYQPITIDPSATGLHYGQLVFEGMKAFRSKEGIISLFRPNYHMQRLNESNDRMCIPQVEETVFLDYIKQLIKIDRGWVPSKEGTSLYVRPFILATESTLAVKESESFLFMTILSPVGSYYKDGLKPIDIYVEDEYVRCVKGGTGMVKTAGNYAGA